MKARAACLTFFLLLVVMVPPVFGENFDPARTVHFPSAGIQLKVPQGWQCRRGKHMVQCTGRKATLAVLSEPVQKDQSLQNKVDGLEDFHAQLATSVKQKEHYLLQERKTFPRQDTGPVIRCLYGFSAKSPSRISYYFLHPDQKMITVRITFSIFETENLWPSLDRMLRNSLALETRKRINGNR